MMTHTGIVKSVEGPIGHHYEGQYLSGWFVRFADGSAAYVPTYMPEPVVGETFTAEVWP